MTVIEQIIDLPLVLKYLREWSKEKHKIALYDVPVGRVFEIEKQIKTITNKFKFAIDSLQDSYTHVLILDIDL